MKNYIEQTRKKLKLDYISLDITIEHFPEEKIRKGFKIFHFNEYLTTEEVISKLDKEGYCPVNLAELLTWAKDWDGKNLVVALGSVWRDRDGGRRVPCLGRGGSKRELYLDWHGDGWYGHCRFAAVRKSLKSESSDSLDSLTPDSMETRIKVLEEFKDKVEKIINLNNAQIR